MSYNDVLDLQAKNVITFARLTRKKNFNRQVIANGGDWNSGGGNTWLSWPYSLTPVAVILGVQINGSLQALTAYCSEVDTLAELSANNTFFYDATAGRVYVSNSIDNPDGGSISSLNFAATVEYESFHSTQEIGFYKVPTDDSTPMIKWSGGIKSTPTISRSASDNYSGFAPSEISPLEVFHNGEDLWTSFYNDSIFQCRCDVWVCIGEVRPENTEMVFSGDIKGMRGDDLSVSFDLVENYLILNGAYDGRFLNTTDFPKLDTSQIGRALPITFGTPVWLKAVNVDSITDGFTTNDNRTWVVFDERGFTTSFQTFTLGTLSGFDGTSYLVTTTADIVQLLHQGDRLRRSSDGTFETVNQVLSATTFRISANVSTPASGDIYTRQPVIEVIFQVPSVQGLTQRVVMGGFASVTVDELNSAVVIVLSSGFEAEATALGLTTLDPNDFEVWAHVSGSPKNLTYQGSYIDNTLGAANDVSMLYWYMTKVMGIDETYIDGASFTAAIATRPTNPNREENMATFVHPIWSSGFEDHKTVISRLLQQIGAIGYFSKNGKFTIIARDYIGSADFVLTDSEIITAPKYEINSDDIRAFQNDASSGIIGVRTQIVHLKPSTFAEVVAFANGVIGPVESTSNALARGELTVDTVELYDICRQTQANTDPNYYLGHTGVARMSKYFSDRRFTVQLRASGPVLEAVPGNIIEIDREYLPGYDFVPGTTRTRKFIVLDCERDGAAIELTLEDQYSIEQQSGEF